MIRPNARSTLVEAVTPPLGYEFDSGVATTYSLDIGTLMVLPVHLTWLAASDDERVQNDPIRLLEGLRRTTKRLTVFADSGRLHVPRMPNALVGLTEEMIYEVQAPHGGAFHPKVWVLRFVQSDGGNEPLIRLMVLSRNLTDDRSWDLSLCLDGRPRGGRHAVNRDLATFLRGLPGMCRHKRPAGDRSAQLQTLSDDLHRCEWDMPQGFDQLIGFHVVGTGAKPKPLLLPKSDEVLVISPFLRDSALASVVASSKRCVGLVARQEEIALLSEEMRQQFPLHVLDDNADLSAEEEVQQASLRGLHAKAFIWRKGAWTHTLVGSANCTNAVLERGSNVEVMAELRGHHSKVGTPADWLTPDKGIGTLLQRYTPLDPSSLLEQRQAEDALEDLRRKIVAAELHLDCQPGDTGRYVLTLHGFEKLADIDGHFKAWPLTVSPDRSRTLISSPRVALGSFLAYEVTSLTGFCVRIGDHELLFGLELPLVNLPEDRDSAVLALLLSNRAAFLRYLALLLGELDAQGGDPDAEAAGAWFGANASTGTTPALFELMLKAFSREPSKLDYVANAVERLRQAQSEGDEPLIPPDFMEMWRIFDEARRKETEQ